MARKKTFGRKQYVEHTIVRNWHDAQYEAEKLRANGIAVKITKEPPRGKERLPWYFVWRRL